MYHVHVQSMKLVRRLHARSMLRWHAVFWRHAQTVALATTLSEIKLANAQRQLGFGTSREVSTSQQVSLHHVI